MLFRNLKNRVTEEEQCDIIIRGLKPSIRAALAGNLNVRRMAELREAAQRVKKLTSFQKEVQVIEQSVDQVKTDASQRKSQRQRSRGHRPSLRDGSFNTDSQRGSPRRRSSPGWTKYADKEFCLNCGDKDHRRENCRAKRKILCYGCGDLGRYVKDCPTCLENGQGGR